MKLFTVNFDLDVHFLVYLCWGGIKT